jgi:hypothetical protein
MNKLNTDEFILIIRTLEDSTDPGSIAKFLSCSKTLRTLQGSVKSTFLVVGQDDTKTFFRLNDGKWDGRHRHGSTVFAPIMDFFQVAHSVIELSGEWDESLVPRSLRSAILACCLGGNSCISEFDILHIDFSNGIRKITLNSRHVNSQTIQLCKDSIHKMVLTLSRSSECRKSPCRMLCNLKLDLGPFLIEFKVSFWASVEREYAEGVRDNNDYFEFIRFTGAVVKSVQVLSHL